MNNGHQNAKKEVALLAQKRPQGKTPKCIVSDFHGSVKPSGMVLC